MVPDSLKQGPPQLYATMHNEKNSVGHKTNGTKTTELAVTQRS